MNEALLIDHMGSDLTVVNAARRSHGVEHREFSFKRRGNGSLADDELIESLVTEGHFLPFRHPHIELSCAAPLPIARQLGKHQVGMTWSEITRRLKHKRAGFTFHMLDGTWRREYEGRGHGTGELLPPLEQLSLEAIQADNVQMCLRQFEAALDFGAAHEQARFLLPQSMDVLWTWTGSLLAWYHVYHMRNHPDVQKECRDFASLLPQLIGELYPVSWGFLTHTFIPPEA